ncbi:MAG: hypothetical protein OES27_04455 [Nitrosopumilus sp.]|nr:hypothetical protein [Nitrosopumilus sp.]
MTSIDDISQMFDDESLKLQNLISIADSKYDLSVHEIVETYYQVMNVSSMSTLLKEQVESQPNSLLNKIQVIDKSISEQFNSDIHPRIMKILSTSIQKTTEKLQSGNTGKKSKEEIKSEAKLFEELRQKMSTREFVDQYNKGLYND